MARLTRLWTFITPTSPVAATPPKSSEGIEKLGESPTLSGGEDEKEDKTFEILKKLLEVMNAKKGGEKEDREEGNKGPRLDEKFFRRIKVFVGEAQEFKGWLEDVRGVRAVVPCHGSRPVWSAHAL